ncbi:MAG: class I SAM-dependent methyltransferase [Candidatus Baldrarchaeia archaeon]
MRGKGRWSGLPIKEYDIPMEEIEKYVVRIREDEEEFPFPKRYLYLLDEIERPILAVKISTNMKTPFTVLTPNWKYRVPLFEGEVEKYPRVIERKVVIRPINSWRFSEEARRNTRKLSSFNIYGDMTFYFMAVMRRYVHNFSVPKMMQTVRFIEHLAPLLRGNERILELGCGKAFLSLCLAYIFPEIEIVGIEVNSAENFFNRVMAWFFGISNVSFITADAENFDYDAIGRFDAIIGLHTHGLAFKLLELVEKWRPRIVMFTPCCFDYNRKKLLNVYGINVRTNREANEYRARLMEEWGYRTKIFNPFDLWMTDQPETILAVLER